MHGKHMRGSTNIPSYDDDDGKQNDIHNVDKRKKKKGFGVFLYRVRQLHIIFGFEDQRDDNKQSTTTKNVSDFSVPLLSKRRGSDRESEAEERDERRVLQRETKRGPFLGARCDT